MAAFSTEDLSKTEVEIVGECESCGQIDPSNDHGNKDSMLSDPTDLF